jgi:hypothetical protein
MLKDRGGVFPQLMVLPRKEAARMPTHSGHRLVILTASILLCAACTAIPTVVAPTETPEEAPGAVATEVPSTATNASD